MVANLDDGKETRLFADGNVNQFAASADGKHLFAVGLVSNEISEGLWHYDLGKASLSCVVPGAGHPSPLVRQIEELHGSITVPDRRPQGRRLDYYLYQPANFNPHEHKKYPLVIGNTLFVNGDPLYQERPHGPLWVQALANGGAFVVVVDRQIWGVGMEHWPENVMAVYRGMMQNPAVDQDRVFLFASSGETDHLSKLLTTNCAPWKGVILVNPGALLDIDHLPYAQRIPKFLISLGQLENRDRQLQSYKESALSHGVNVDYLIHAGGTHWLSGATAVRERTEALMHFVLDNH